MNKIDMLPSEAEASPLRESDMRTTTEQSTSQRRRNGLSLYRSRDDVLEGGPP